MQGPRLVLIHSPRTGPSYWAGVCTALWARGSRAYAPRLPAARFLQPPYWLTHAAGAAATLPEEGELVLIGHGGACALLPAIGRLARNRGCSAYIAGYLLVDGALPRDGCCRLDLLADTDAAALRESCVDGWLPRWSEQELGDMLPDAAQRAAFAAEQPLTPLSLYEELISVPDDWPEAPCGYLSMTAEPNPALAQARALKWPLRCLTGHSLQPVAHPALVAEALLELLASLRH